MAAFRGGAERPAYAATKAGINALARHVASRWGKEGLRANAITPGLVLTPQIQEGAPPQMLQAMLSRTRSTPLGHADDTSSIVAFLLSDEGSSINAQLVTVDDG